MKRYSWVLLILFITACSSEQKVSDQPADTLTGSKRISKWVTDTAMLSKTDTAFIEKPVLAPDGMSCAEDTCRIRIRFSSNLPDLEYSEAIGADLYLAGDLDGDGHPELLLRPEWFTSCWAALNVFSLKNGAWKKITSGSMYWCSDDNPLNKRIERKDKSFILVCDSMADAEFVITRKPIIF